MQPADCLHARLRILVIKQSGMKETGTKEKPDEIRVFEAGEGFENFKLPTLPHFFREVTELADNIKGAN